MWPLAPDTLLGATGASGLASSSLLGVSSSPRASSPVLAKRSPNFAHCWLHEEQCSTSFRRVILGSWSAVSLFRSRTRREKHRYFPSLTQHQRESVLEDEWGGEGDEADDAGAAAEEDEEAMFDGDERTRPGAADAAQTPAPPLLLVEYFIFSTGLSQSMSSI